MTYLELSMVVSLAFLLVVAPLWLILHYRSKRWQVQRSTPQVEQELEAMVATMAGMEERIKVLEALLDRQAPSWRDHR